MISLPQLRGDDVKSWAARLVSVLSRVLPEAGWEIALVPVGTVVGIPSGADVPPGYIACDGSSQPSSKYPALAKLFGVTSGNFTLPTGSSISSEVDWVIRTG